ncbi:hypothetical protein HCH_06723 [Hahella chejuensis KCTC 2396]|uniref:Uncharacterized protein n=1 Tax=Hahella chejuensis (strain KCTC 2396) TaxID=349521 RepID=Q2S7M5_HAHCH|nr:hypothetical protein [Hahella chejuensis]ABC33349.1 hypothetical protein HCH_06723 [Hahella chejuensis KCTC 2396]
MEDILVLLLRLLGVIAQGVLYFVMEFLIKGPGYLIHRLFAGKHADLDGLFAIVFGIVFWVVVGLGAYFIYRLV